MIRPFASSKPEPLEESRLAAPTLLPWAIKVSLILTAVGFGASFYLSKALPGSTTSAQLARLAEDPATTGSIAGSRRSSGIVPRPSPAGNMDLRLR